MKKIIFTILIINLLFLVSCGSDNSTGAVTLNSEKTCKNFSYETQEEYIKTEYYSETVPYTDQECEYKELNYKSSNDDIDRETSCIQDHEECLDYFLGICTEKRTVCDKFRQSCRFSITNLDNEKGYWTYKWTYSCNGDSKVIDSTNMGEEISIGEIDPTETKDAWSQIIFQPDVNKNYCGCYARIVHEPSKQVCRDVIKYKEIQKSRDVTAYKPVIRYREVCE